MNWHFRAELQARTRWQTVASPVADGKPTAEPDTICSSNADIWQYRFSSCERPVTWPAIALVTYSPPTFVDYAIRHLQYLRGIVSSASAGNSILPFAGKIEVVSLF